MASPSLSALDDFDNIPELDIAYISGLIDADGTITLNSTRKQDRPGWKYPAAMVLVVNGNLGLIRWLQKTIGFGCAYETKTAPIRPDQNSAHWNRVHRYQITNRVAQCLVKRCRPYLRVKDAQADLVLSMASRGFGFAVRASDDQRAHAYECLRRIRILNQRGKKDEYQYEMVG